MGKIGAIMGVCLAGLCGGCGVQGGGADDAVPGADENADVTQHSFAVRLSSATDVENIPAQIASAGREQIAALCAAEPGGAIRIYNPLASGAYEDTPCAAVLSGGAPSGEASAALASEEGDEPIGTVGQKWSPFGLVCSLLTIGSGLVAGYALCPRATSPDDKRNCDYVTAGGLSGLGLLCFLL